MTIYKGKRYYFLLALALGLLLPVFNANAVFGLDTIAYGAVNGFFAFSLSIMFTIVGKLLAMMVVMLDWVVNLRIYTNVPIIQEGWKIMRDFAKRIFSSIFKRRSNISIGFYGPPNAGKTSLANRICKDWTGEEIGTVSKIPHETRNVQFKEKVEISYKGKKITFKLVDTPGIATKIDYEDFMKFKLSEKEAKTRAKEATKGVIVSAAGFTKPAKDFMKANRNQIELIDFEDLTGLFNRYFGSEWYVDLEGFILDSMKRHPQI